MNYNQLQVYRVLEKTEKLNSKRKSQFKDRRHLALIF